MLGSSEPIYRSFFSRVSGPPALIFTMDPVGGVQIILRIVMKIKTASDEATYVRCYGVFMLMSHAHMP